MLLTPTELERLTIFNAAEELQARSSALRSFACSTSDAPRGSSAAVAGRGAWLESCRHSPMTQTTIRTTVATTARDGWL